MVCHMLWRRDLGGPRVQLELAEQLTAMGHHVEKFSWEDAYPGRTPRLLPGRLAGFARRAERFVRQHADSFDVIDAHQGNILHAGTALGLCGAVVVRSAGLHHFHREWQRNNRNRSPGVRGILGLRRRQLVSLLNERAAETSFDVADRVLVPNENEATFLSRRPEWACKVETVPNAISTATWNLLSRLPIRTPRPGEGTVVFVGAWGPDKGSRDWGRIVRKVWLALPSTQFLFAGTAVARETVLTDLGMPSDPRVEVIKSFTPGDLPALLSRGSIGGFPSYVEGFGLAVLEKLAAGLPVVAYDVPGPRQLLAPLGSGLLIAPGNADAFASKLVDLLTEQPESHRSRALACREAASVYTWDAVAPLTLDLYRAAREGLE